MDALKTRISRLDWDKHVQYKVTSFGYVRRKAPTEPVLDIRKIVPNVMDFSLTGLDPEIQTWLKHRPNYTDLITYASAILWAYTRLSIGCSYGRHRSVAVAECLAEEIKEAAGIEIMVEHKELKSV